MSAWPEVSLGEVAHVNPRLGAKLDDADVVSFLGMTDASDDGTTNAGIDRPYSEVRKGYTPFEAGDVLVAKITPCFQNGKIVQASTRHSQGFGSTEFHVLRSVGDGVDHRYLLHFLRQQYIRIDGERRMTGSGGQRRVPVDFLKSLTIPLPAIETQRRVATILDHADTLRAKRREAIARLDELYESFLWETLGDLAPARTEWDCCRIDEAGAVQLGRQRSPKYQTGADSRPYLRVANVHRDRLELDDVLTMDFAEKDFQTYRLETGDILLNEGQTSELVGRPAMWRGEIEDCCFQNSLIRFTAYEDRCLPEYALAVFLRYMDTGEFSRVSAKTSSVAHLGAARFAAMPIPLPPLDVQREFAKLVDGVNEQKVREKRSLAQLDSLFKSLQSRAFRDEL